MRHGRNFRLCLWPFPFTPYPFPFFIIFTGSNNVVNKKAQSKAGIAATRRGQQMGDERSNNTEQQQEGAKADTPALSGRREEANKFYADESAQGVGGSPAAPSSTSPSVPAALPTNIKKGEPGGERVFKERQARKGGKGKG